MQWSLTGTNPGACYRPYPGRHTKRAQSGVAVRKGRSAATSVVHAKGSDRKRAGAPLFPCNEFKRNDGVLYWPNFFSEKEFSGIAGECSGWIHRTKPERNTLAKGRRGLYLPADCDETASAVLSERVRERVGRKVGATLLPGDYPIELRLYPIGAYMDWHVDEVMYREAQYEMILTLENSSDSFTEWVDASGQTVSIWAEPNSLIVVKAGAALHQVTRIKKGRRAILKFVLTPTLEKNGTFEENLNRAAF